MARLLWLDMAAWNGAEGKIRAIWGVATLVPCKMRYGDCLHKLYAQKMMFYHGNRYKYYGVNAILGSKCAGIHRGWGLGLLLPRL